MGPIKPAGFEHDVLTERFIEPRKLLAHLRISDEKWTKPDAWTTPWVFRGQSCSCWSPVPSSWRTYQSKTHLYKEAFDAVDIFDMEIEAQSFRYLSLTENELMDRLKTHFVQRRFEYLAVSSFAEVANRLGMRVPYSTQDHALYSAVGSEPPVVRIEALAQHHGMPTRLLDWTENPLYAAFFAASTPSKCEIHGENGDVSIWALSLDDDHLPSYDWLTFRVPRHENDFLNAQSGLFLYHAYPSQHLLTDGSWPDLLKDRRQLLRKINFPKKKCRELMRLLWVEGVSLAKLMPTLDNVKSALDLMWEVIALEKNKQTHLFYDDRNSDSASMPDRETGHEF